MKQHISAQLRMSPVTVNLHPRQWALLEAARMQKFKETDRIAPFSELVRDAIEATYGNLPLLKPKKSPGADA